MIGLLSIRIMIKYSDKQFFSVLKFRSKKNAIFDFYLVLTCFMDKQIKKLNDWVLGI